jgi:hypothetical protein
MVLIIQRGADIYLKIHFIWIPDSKNNVHHIDCKTQARIILSGSIRGNQELGLPE